MTCICLSYSAHSCTCTVCYNIGSIVLKFYVLYGGDNTYGYIYYNPLAQTCMLYSNVL